MSGTREGGLKARATNLARDPEFYKRIGRKGGQNGHDGGFASKKVGADGLTGLQRASVAGIKGGRISKRGRKKGDAKSPQVLAQQDFIRAKLALEEIKRIVGVTK